MYFDLAIRFFLTASSIALVVSDLLEVVFIAETTRWRSAAFADGKWDGNIGW
jgi:hypothetical protein